MLKKHQKKPTASLGCYDGLFAPQAFEGDKKVAIIPTWGFDIDYRFNPKWAVYAQADLKMQSFEVEDKQDVILSRNYPISVAALAHFRPIPHWSVFVGPGREFESSKSLWIFKIGTEYAFEFSERFELGVLLMYENREELYDGWSLGVSYNFRLWHRNQP
jgi:hypothetical protein